MKKIYLASCLMALSLLLSFVNLQAQSNASDCFGSPSIAPNAAIFHVKNLFNTGTNTLYFQGYPAGATVRIYDNNLAILFEQIVPASGILSWTYNANTPTPPQQICQIPPTATGCCLRNVPALSACPTNAFPASNPFTINGLCALLTKVYKGDKVVLSDQSGVIINGVVEQYRIVDNLDPLLETVCVAYPCNETVGYITSCGKNGCCTRPYKPGGIIFPVIITKFVGSLVKGNAVLYWSTSLEINSKKYVIEKSADGRNFSAIGEVAAAGGSTSTISYSFTDNNTTAGGSFYRLKIVDIDDTYEYTKVVYINNGKGGTAISKIFPNPFTSDIQIIGISSSDLTRANVRVFNAQGQEVNYAITGANSIAVSETAPRGVYILRVKEQQFKLMKL
jgi:hypothetical protein